MPRGSIVVISGGSAANNLVDVFKGLTENSQTTSLSYVIGISDNGGSTSEIIRVFGGPGIGDIRSRLVRLVPDNPSLPEISAIKRLLNYRLPSTPDEARTEWNQIVDGHHPFWQPIPSEKRELLRSFFIFLSSEITKRNRPTSAFNFQLASLGNLFLTGCRLFFGSLESAVYLLRCIVGVPENIHVIPALNSNFSHHIAAGLSNGLVIAGQNQISHPSDDHEAPTPGEPNSQIVTPLEDVEDANLPGSLPSLRKGYIVFTKEHETELPARIERMWYINPYGQEIRPPANTKALTSLKEAECLVYSIGSLYTSIIPCLILRGIGEAIAASPQLRYKILILNGSFDREIGPGTDFTALDFIKAITLACVESRGVLPVEDRGRLLGEGEYKKYVSHVIYMEGPDVPTVDKVKLRSLGIESWRIAGRKNPGGKGLVYDGDTLKQMLEMVMGKRMPSSRRSTVDATNAGVHDF